MKKFVINKILNYIYENKEYSEEEKDVIKYGISNLYLQLTKLFVITFLAIILKIFIPYLTFIIIYNILRLPSFGVHAKKSYQCWISSTVIFISLPFLTTITHLNIYIKIFLLSISIIYITIHSPADTEKRPIISPKRRLMYKYLSCFLSILYSFLCLFINDQIVSNSLLFSLLLQCVIISPIAYKIFGMTYDNYKKYQREEESVCLQES